MALEPSRMLPAKDVTRALGFKNRSSLTRLVQRGVIAPVFTGSGPTGEQFFDPDDVARLVAARKVRASRALAS